VPSSSLSALASPVSCPLLVHLWLLIFKDQKEETKLKMIKIRSQFDAKKNIARHNFKTTPGKEEGIRPSHSQSFFKTIRFHAFTFILLFDIVRGGDGEIGEGRACPNLNLGSSNTRIRKPPRLLRQGNCVIKWPYLPSCF
jgi:hypothetical protein